jgi:hypothetical protein
MPKQNSIFKTKGTIDDVTFYKSREGEYLMKKKSGITKERIATDPRFESVRQLNKEFRCAAIAAGFIKGASSNFKEMCDTRAFSRILKVCREIISQSDLERGTREFDPVTNKQFLRNLNFNRTVSFDAVFPATFQAEVNAGRNGVTITVPVFNPAQAIHAPINATHFKLINLIAIVPTVAVDPVTRKYGPVNYSGKNNIDFEASDYIDLKKQPDSEIVVTTELPGNEVPSAESVLMACVGIEFYQKIGNFYYVVHQDNAMKIEDLY